MPGPPPAVALTRQAVRTAVRTVLASLRRDTPDAAPQRGQARAGVLVACSGGADSLALAAAVAFEAPRAGVSAGLVTIDHGLQQGSSEQARRVAAIGFELGLDPVEIVPVSVGTTGGPEAAARSARYDALDAVAAALDASVLLGHTLDDQAETVLLGLGRGSGPRSIAGMAAVDGRWVRPFLGLRRATTERACAELGLEPWDDPHNSDPAYQRVRLRREVLPLLEDVLHGGVAEALARTADLVRDDLDALDIWARHATARPPAPPSRHQERTSGDQERECVVIRPDPSVDHGKMRLDVAAVADLPWAVRTRVLRTWAATAGAGPLTAAHLAALDALVVAWRGQGHVDLPGPVRVRRESGTLVAYPARPPSPPAGDPAP